MNSIAVLDWRNGQLVAAVGGQRASYRRLEDVWNMPRQDPWYWIQQLNQKLGVQHFYWADLDSIEGRGSDIQPLIKQMLDRGWHVWLDAGRSQQAQQTHLAFGHNDHYAAVFPTEGVQRLSQLLPALEQWRSVLGRLIVSLDWCWTANQQLAWYGSNIAWDPIPWQCWLDQVHDLEIDELLVLNLADVGADGNSMLASHWPATDNRFRWYLGGGIRDEHDRKQVAADGYQAALIGSWNWRQLGMQTPQT